MGKHPGGAKVSQLQFAVGRNENVVGLEVAVQNVALVQVLEGVADLTKL